MDTQAVAQLWNQNAENWTLLARQGCDTFRDLVNTPAFLELLPDVRGLKGLDVGCGDGTNTRSVAGLGASMSGIDVAERFLSFAQETERSDPRGIDYQLASATELPFEDQSFDFVTAFMSLMDLPEQARALSEARRVLRPGGFLQFSICHPCFHTRCFGWIRDEQGKRVALKVGDYFDPPWAEVEEWTFSAATDEAKAALPNYQPFKVPRFSRTLSDWLNLVTDAGLLLERFCEPRASEAAMKIRPTMSSRSIAFSLIVRARRPSE